MSDAKRIYRWLLRLYPARFREEYQGPLERQFQDEYRDTQGRGGKRICGFARWPISPRRFPRRSRARCGRTPPMARGCTGNGHW